MKQGLSRRIVNSQGSKKGFLKSIGFGLAPLILNGPFGWGAVESPLSRQLYSPPSGLWIIRSATASPSKEGSNLMLSVISDPSYDSAGGAMIDGYSTEKSMSNGGNFAFGSGGG